jgi:hypothetical protein
MGTGVWVLLESSSVFRAGMVVVDTVGTAKRVRDGNCASEYV